MDISKDIFKDWEVVIVDDDPFSLDIAASLLKYAGAVVHLAQDGREGVELVQKIKPRLIITDLSMPVLDGWGLISQLKRDPATAQIPIIALTAHAMIGDREKAIAAGCHNYLTKPLLPENFLTGLVNIVTNIADLAPYLQTT